MAASRTLRVVVSLLLTAVLVALFVWNVDLGEVAAALARASLPLVAASALLGLLSYWLRVLRWQLILAPAGGVSHREALLATVVGYAAMALLPARMGDLVRPLVVARRTPLSTSAALASILTERIFDLWTVVAAFLVFALWPPAMPELGEAARVNLARLHTSGLVAMAGMVLGTLLLLALFRFQRRFVALLGGLAGRVRASWRAPVEAFLGHFLDGLRVLQRPGQLLLTLAASAAVWGVIYWQLQVSLAALGVTLPLRACFLLVALSVIGLAIPTPAGVGGFHAALQFGLTSFFAVDLATATGVAIVHHAACFLPITLLGLACIPLLGFSLHTVQAPPADEEERA